jgi:hypothetical protein
VPGARTVLQSFRAVLFLARAPLMTRRPATILALALALGLAVPGAARADTSAEQRAAAQALFDDARRLMAEKKYADACPKLEESQRIDPGLGTLLNLAECQSLTGRTASAWANFLEAAYQAKAAGQSKRENTARARAAALEPKLSKMTIIAVVPAGTKVEIKRDGSVVAASLVGTPVPVDPGEHTVSASAPGKQPWESKVRVNPDGHQVTVSVPQLEDAAAKPPPEVKPPLPPPLPPPPPPQPPPEIAPPSQPPTPPAEVKSGKAPRAAGIVLTILGAGGLGVGVAYAVIAKQKLDDSNQQGCSGNVCSGAGFDLRNTARTDGNVATGALIGGGVVTAAGVGLLIAASVIEKSGPGSAPKVSVGVDPRGGASIGLNWRF